MASTLTTTLPSYNALVSSAQRILPKRRLTPTYESWQAELWDYYDRLGEFEAGISWQSNTMSRVRLLAAELSITGDEPTPIDDPNHPAVQAVSRLAGGTGGQAQLMREFTTHLSVPGECWLVGEQPFATPGDEEAARMMGGEGPMEETWSIKSADEIRVARKRIDDKATYEVREGESQTSWRLISPDSLVVRVWDPHPRFGWRADSAARHCIGALMELDLINKRIVATVMSRLASNGILLYDKSRLSIPSQGEQPEGAEKVDPFGALLVEVASRAIKDPTSPEASLPIPIGFDIESLQDVDPRLLLQFLSPDNTLDAKLLDQRESAVRRLATSMDMPPEILLGMGGINHWGQWQIEESGIKVHVSPKAELVCYSLTTGYLVPSLRAEDAPLVGPNGGRIVVWYDPSEITTRPDKSETVMQLYDRMEVSGRTLRRESGLSEEDAPTDEERQLMAIMQTRRYATLLPALIQYLGGPQFNPVVGSTVVDDPTAGDPTGRTSGGGGGGGEAPAPIESDGAPSNGTGPPATEGDPDPALAGV